jgi:hypothetical protein
VAPRTRLPQLVLRFERPSRRADAEDADWGTRVSSTKPCERIRAALASHVKSD